MAAYRNRRWTVERPHAATFLLLTINLFVFWLCLSASNSATIAAQILYANGAMYTQALPKQEYWRLIAYGFLHANPLHLIGNMFCLALWGGLLEKRIGSCYFLIVYFCAIIAGALISDFHRSQPYLLVGASGAISGILGALFCLWVLGKIELSAQFFLVNIGLNIALALSSPKIDWVAHFGGFVAGVILCALIDLLEKANRFVLRCKFPEFIKVNALALVVALGLLLWSLRPQLPFSDGMVDWFWPVCFAALCLAAIKIIDGVLSAKRGLAVIVVLFAIANAGVIVLAIRLAMPNFSCASLPVEGARDALACSNWQIAIAIAICVFAATLIINGQDLSRGTNDVGFIGSGLRAERQRRRGI